MLKNSQGVVVVRLLFLRGHLLVLGFVSFLVFVGTARSEDSPSDVALRFVAALDVGNSEVVVKCVYEPWMSRELDALVEDLSHSSVEEREGVAESFGASSYRDFVVSPRSRFYVVWVTKQWPYIFPPAPPSPFPSPPKPHRWCGTADYAHRAKRRAELQSDLDVWVVEELVEGKHDAFVSLEVRHPRSFQEVYMEFSLVKDSWGDWRIDGAENWLVSE